ncbi:penicillin-binding protein 1A [Sphingomonas jejuensis]|uniref:peptidoglycan glycosyltransferase n=1 Tax=Sphingomonas jejuensis TaxID=904715 RepID=A0ABX0XNS7_9SPHN|nr:PBP1A family penicillin-binding protein [Sphingomonas jejuensis]NJC35038.1 penicillin-binding protein 1A [Sphingomonas jejuensis]
MATTPPRTRKRRPGVIRRLIQIGLVIGAVLLIGLLTAVGLQAASLPSFDALRSSPNGQMIRVRAADGSVLISLGPSYGEWLAYRDIPPVMAGAIVAVEDRRFRSHPGVDPIGIARGIKVSFESDNRVRGVSTISQQLARNIFLTNDRSYGRKIKEGILALALEWKFSKNEILELYLNKVYFGGGAYGIDAASRRFFGHPATELSTGEAAIIAGLVKAPSNYSPTADADAAVARAQVVLRLMRREGVVSAAEASNVDFGEVRPAPEENQTSVRYFTDWALPQLDTLIDETSEPIDVWTTIDPRMQAAAERSIRANTPSGVQGALVSLDRDGAVRAMIGGKDYVSSNYNRATQATRQPGSAFKLFVYLAALEAGYTPEDTVVDEPININGWSPRNSSRRFSGAMTLRSAFAYSINTIAAKLGQDVGFGTVADMARRFGITSPLSVDPSITLGTSDVRLIDMTRAYASVGQRGVAVTPYGITRVATADGRLLYEHEVDTSRVLVTPWVAAEMVDLMQSAVTTGSARAADIGRPVAGKTGTTSSNKDGWFLGFSSGLTTGVWMGRDDARAVGGLQGGTAPARAFADFMRTAVARRPVEAFATEVTLPEWQMEPDEEAYFGDPDNGIDPSAAAPGDQRFVDENGNPVGGRDPRFDGPAAAPEQEQEPDQDWIDEVLGRGTRSREDQPREPAEPRSTPPARPVQPQRGEPDGIY